MVRDEPKREILYDLSEALGAVRGKVGPGELSALTAVYHNLLRIWAET
jgi:predicted 2-oxoglutarate/Fe(II)-dependent dioxygenase YbiX